MEKKELGRLLNAYILDGWEIQLPAKTRQAVYAIAVRPPYAVQALSFEGPMNALCSLMEKLRDGNWEQYEGDTDVSTFPRS